MVERTEGMKKEGEEREGIRDEGCVVVEAE